MPDPPPAPPDPNTTCLANAVFREARGEPLEGQRAVLDVIANRRVATGLSACQILAQRKQFQWVRKYGMMPDSLELVTMLKQAQAVPRVLNSEKYFFATSKHPVWAVGMKCRRIGHHKFCNERAQHESKRTD